MTGAGQPRPGAKVALIARREIDTRVRQKSFRISLAVTLGLIAVVAFLPKFVGGDDATSYNLATVGPAAPIGPALQRIAAQRNVKITVHPARDEAEAADKVRAGDWDAALIGDQKIIAKSATSDAALLMQVARQSVVSVDRLRRSGLDPNQVTAALEVPALPVAAQAADTGKKQTIALITIVALFAQLIGFCSWVAMGVVEEKTSRVVELVLSTVRPWQLLAGKLLGIGTIAIGQLAAFAVVGLGVATIFDTVSLPSGTLGAAAGSVVWFVIAFGFYAALSAGLGSLVSRQEEVSGVLSPVTGLLMVTYLLAFAVIYTPDTTLAKVLSFVPPVSAITMPGRMAHGNVPWPHVVLSAALMLAVTVGAVALAAKIYRAAVLHTGSKLSLRRAWRGEAAADLA